VLLVLIVPMRVDMRICIIHAIRADSILSIAGRESGNGRFY